MVLEILPLKLAFTFVPDLTTFVPESHAKVKTKGIARLGGVILHYNRLDSMKKITVLLFFIIFGFVNHGHSQAVAIAHGKTKMKYGAFYRASGNLRYSLTNNEIIAIKLTDSKEKYIKGYLNYELKEKGEHEQTIKLPPDLAPGLYFLTISTIHGDKLKIKIKM